MNFKLITNTSDLKNYYQIVLSFLSSLIAGIHYSHNNAAFFLQWIYLGLSMSLS